MKILYVTLINKENALARNRHQLIHFVDKLGRMTDLYVYNRYGDMFQNATNIYNHYTQIKDAIDDIKPDILFCYRSKRMLNEPPIKDIPVIFMEQEYPLWRTPDLIENIQKHNTKAVILTGWFPEAEKALGVPVYWLPFSANEDYFYTDRVDHSTRKKEVCFFGVAPSNRIGGTYAYRVRRKAMKYLSTNGLMQKDPPAPEQKKSKWLIHPEQYPLELKTYCVALACAFNTLGQVPLKSFEIMASGTALLTQPYKPEITRRLFGDDPPYMTYKKDCTDIVYNAQRILEWDEYRVDMCKHALHLVNTRHLHKHRVLELYEILTAVLENRRHQSQLFLYI